MAYYDWSLPEPEFAELLGKTLIEIEGAAPQSEEIRLVCSDGSTYVMHHSLDCCESVEVESITGDIAALLGTPLLVAEESTSEETPEGFKHEYEPESQTWTFYKLATVKGWVDIRWFGRSNGYYSERVRFVRIDSASPSENP